MWVEIKKDPLGYAVGVAFVAFLMWCGWQSSAGPSANSNSPTQTQNSSTIVTAEHSPDKLTDWLLVIFNGLLFGSTLMLWVANKRSADIAKAALTEIERAFISVQFDMGQMVNRARGRTEQWVVVPKWKNAGSTPAKNMFTHSSSNSFPGKLPDDFTFPDIMPQGQSEHERSFVAPQDEIITDGITFTSEELLAVKDGKIRIYIWGWAEYDDVFEGSPPHRTEFCNEIVLSDDPFKIYENGARFPVSLKIYPKHIGADEGCFREARPAHLRKNILT
jgi:hypothetical protein